MNYETLPADLQKKYQPSGIYKVKKKGSSTLVIHTAYKTRDVWKKSGKSWTMDTTSEVVTNKRAKKAGRVEQSTSHASGCLDYAKEHTMPRTLWGQNINAQNDQD